MQPSLCFFRRKRKEAGTSNPQESGQCSFGDILLVVLQTFCLFLLDTTIETVEEQIVRHLTSKRIKELDRSLAKMKEDYMCVHTRACT